MTAPVVIVGTGLAGYNLAREFRKLDSETPLLLISADDGRSYSKPMLSTGFAKDKAADQLVMAEPGAMADQLDARVWTHTRVTGIDPGHKRLWIGEEAVEYRDLILAWGAETLRVPVAGDAGAWIFPINDLEDYARFRTAAQGKRRVLVLGAGLIGCEFANDLAAGGYQVEVVAPCEQLMPTLLPAPAAAAVQGALESLGVRFHLGPLLDRLEQTADGLAAHLSDGQVLGCDLVVAAVGLRPRTDMAIAAGLQVNRGIVVDRKLRTSHPNIHALGDCAEVAGHNLLYVMPLMQGARALAKTLAGQPSEVSYGAMPVMVKTPACPVVVAPPALGAAGEWQISGSGADIRGEFRSPTGALLGYVLTGAATQQKLALNRELPAILL